MAIDNTELALELEEELVRAHRQGRTTENFLRCMPGSTDYRKDPKNPGHEEVTLLLSVETIKRIKTDGVKVEIEDLKYEIPRSPYTVS